MVVITGICLVAQADVVRYRPLLLVLAAGKTASSLGSLGFFLFDPGRLHLPAQLPGRRLPRAASRSGSGRWPAASAARRARLTARAGAVGRRATHPERDLRGDGARASTACPRPSARSTSPGRSAEFLALALPADLSRLRLGLRAFEWLPFPWRFSRLDPGAREDFLRRWRARASPPPRPAADGEDLLDARLRRRRPRSRSGSGLETSCRLADGSLPEPAGPLGDTEPPARARNATSSSSAPAPAARSPRRRWPRRAST